MEKNEDFPDPNNVEDNDNFEANIIEVEKGAKALLLPKIVLLIPKIEPKKPYSTMNIQPFCLFQIIQKIAKTTVP